MDCMLDNTIIYIKFVEYDNSTVMIGENVFCSQVKWVEIFDLRSIMMSEIFKSPSKNKDGKRQMKKASMTKH